MRVAGIIVTSCAMMVCALLAGADGRPSSLRTAGGVAFFVLLAFAIYLIVGEVRSYLGREEKQLDRRDSR